MAFVDGLTEFPHFDFGVVNSLQEDCLVQYGTNTFGDSFKNIFGNWSDFLGRVDLGDYSNGLIIIAFFKNI